MRLCSVLFPDTLRPCSVPVLPSSLSIHGWSLAKALIIGGSQNGDFCHSLISSAFISWSSDVSAFTSLPVIHSFVYLQQSGLMDSYSVDYKPSSLLFVLVLTFSQTWPVGPFHAGSCVLSTCPHHPLNTSLLILKSTPRYSKHILYFFTLIPRISHFFKEPRSF